MTLTFDLESGVRVSCGVGYLFANFSLPRPLCSRLRLARCTRQTDVRQTYARRQTKASLNPPPVRGGGITMRGPVSLPELFGIVAVKLSQLMRNIMLKWK